MKRVIRKKVLNGLNKQMLPGKVPPKTKVLLDVFDGKRLSRLFGMVFREPRAAVVVEKV